MKTTLNILMLLINLVVNLENPLFFVSFVTEIKIIN